MPRSRQAARPGPHRAGLGEERRDADEPAAVERSEVPRVRVVVMIEDRGFGRQPRAQHRETHGARFRRP